MEDNVQAVYSTHGRRIDADIQKRFTYHTPKPDQIPRYNRLRQMAMVLAKETVALTPQSREQSLALTKLEEFVMWANAAIARNET